jgi:hypothetical protein
MIKTIIKMVVMTDSPLSMVSLIWGGRRRFIISAALPSGNAAENA